MRQFECNNGLTPENILYFNDLTNNGVSILLEFKNTKGLYSSLIKDLNSDMVLFKINGGYDESISKYDDHYYQQRTIYTLKELIVILKRMEQIERGINPTWNQYEKAMYVYKTLCEYFTYSESQINGRDSARNLLGLINGKSVCAGFSIIYKEMMERLGITCYYQNIPHTHSFNVLEINGECYGIDLTWDTYNKVNNTCKFENFGVSSTKAFYDDCPFHNISNEPYEEKKSLSVFSNKQIRNMLNKISLPRVEYRKINGSSIVSGTKIIDDNNKLRTNNHRFDYERNDGSTFIILPTKVSGNSLNEFIYVDLYKPDILRVSKIYSEMNLLSLDPYIRSIIANSLLSSSRITQKIESYNGYVGYISQELNYKRVANLDIEESLNIRR